MNLAIYAVVLPWVKEIIFQSLQALKEDSRPGTRQLLKALTFLTCLFGNGPVQGCRCARSGRD